ncbi:MAG: hypothetical protein ACW9W3_05860 [Candidatus Nitrosopumilus sp. bin_68KS]
MDEIENPYEESEFHYAHLEYQAKREKLEKKIPDLQKILDKFQDDKKKLRKRHLDEIRELEKKYKIPSNEFSSFFEEHHGAKLHYGIEEKK